MQLGIDGCRAGWIAAIDKPSGVEIELHPNLNELLGIYNPCVVAIDMVIGLPTQTVRGGRLADRAARVLLPGKSSSIFSVPCREAIYASTYQHAVELSRASSSDQMAFSLQAFNIFPKIRELDQWLRLHPDRASQLTEVHPELCFRFMHPQEQVAPSKHSKEGLLWRKQLLANQQLKAPASIPKGCAQHDVYDALACLWSARRISQSVQQSVLDHSPLDGEKLPMNIGW